MGVFLVKEGNELCRKQFHELQTRKAFPIYFNVSATYKLYAAYACALAYTRIHCSDVSMLVRGMGYCLLVKETHPSFKDETCT